MLDGWVDAQTARAMLVRSEDPNEDALAAGHLHLSPPQWGTGSATARG